MAPAEVRLEQAVAKAAPVEERLLVPDVSVSGIRRGQALFVRVVAVAPDRMARSEIEKADYWHVAASSEGVVLSKLVNGSTKVLREESRTRGRWDVTVTFDAAFHLPADATETEVFVAPPGADFKRFVIAGL